MPLKSSPEFIQKTGKIIFMIDKCLEGDKSVTNDAENVVELCHAHWPDHRYVYLDTDGEWTEMKHNGSVLTGFQPYIGETP